MQYDLLVVGGGINGVGIARDAAGRGLKVLLCEQHDLAAHTSSNSTKLIHGGLRYLEYYEFNLVRKALQEREVLLRAAPHIMWPLRFVMPHDRHLRPVWLIRAGLFLYDHLAKRELLPGSQTINLAEHEAGRPLKGEFRKGFVYSDGWVQDARLVVLNAMDAAARGATVLTRTRCTSAKRSANGWQISLQGSDGSQTEVGARALVNAAGPWVGQFLSDNVGLAAAKSVRLVKGSHIVVRKLFDHPYAYIFQNPDKRIIFAIPYEQDFTLIGTTDVEYEGDASQVAIDQDEIAYLCKMASRYFRQTVSPSDVVWNYSGVRPLLDDESDNAASVTRDYSLELDEAGAPLLSVFGGKITTYRKLAEDAVEKLLPLLGSNARRWTADAPLPGGDFTSPVSLQAELARSYPELPERLLRRLVTTYGTRARDLLGQAQRTTDLGEEIAPGLYAAEVHYLVDHEWARSAKDVLWRRTKLGLHLPQDAEAKLDAWMNQNVRNETKDVHIA